MTDIRVPQKYQFSRRRFLELSTSAAGGLVVAAYAQPALAAASAASVAAAPPATVADSVYQISAQQASVVKLQMWKAPHKPAGEEVKIAESVLASLHNTQPGIQVDYTEVPWDKYTEQMTSAFASNTPPDITYQTEGIATYAIPGQLEPIDSYLNQQAGLRDAYLTSSYVPGTINGALYGMPWVFAGNSLIWNKDLFEQAGLDPNTPPDTWDQVLEFGAKLTKPDQQQYGLMIGPKTALEFHGWNTVFWPLNAGGRFTNDDFTEIYLDEKESVYAATFYGDLFNKYQITPPAEMGTVTGQLMSLFTAGKGGFAWEVNTALATIQDSKPSFTLGVGPKPAGPVRDPIRARAGYGSVGYLAISKASAHKPEAWAAIKYLAEPDPLQAWVKLLGWQSVRYDTSFAAGDPLIQAVEANLKYATQVNEYMPDKPYRGDVMNAFLSAYEAIALGQISAQDGMNQAAQQSRDLIAAHNA
jgi:ABC-type glycerol-3-phosphate transport system substrate-binding protein